MKHIINLNNNWNFAKAAWNDTDPAVLAPLSQQVTLPHTWYTDGDYYQGEAVYQKAFTLAKSLCSEYSRYFVRFYGADKICKIYVNGILTGEHRGGYSAFAIDITDAVKPEEENLITVFISNETGKTVSPLSGDFTVFGGLYRDVELIATQEEHFDLTYYGTDGVLFKTVSEKPNCGYLQAAAHVCGNVPGMMVYYSLHDPDGNLVAHTQTEAHEAARLTVESPLLWNGRTSPCLYQATASLIVNGTVVDQVVKQVGFRNIRIDAEKGFFLNGQPIKLNGVAKHQDTADVYCAVSPANLDRDMELIKEIGANAIRLSHYQHPQYFLDLCDQNGMLVWAEIPMLRMTESNELLDNAKEQLKELILQNLHHPCVAMWGLQNEIAMFGEKEYLYDRVAQLHLLAKQLDPFRLTASANLNTVDLDSKLNRITDIVAYNLYYGWYYGTIDDMDKHLDEFHRINPTVPLGISEYGVDANTRFHADHPQQKDYSEEFQAWYHEQIYPKFQRRSFVWGTFIWNMFDFCSAIRDEGGTKFRNNKGLVTHDRKIRKDAFYYYKARWSDKPFVYITGKRYANRPVGFMDVKVYANVQEVELVAGNERYKTESDNGIFIFPNVAVGLGANSIRAIANGCCDEAVFTGVLSPDETYTFHDPNPGINVKNWFTDEVERLKSFPEDAYTILDQINTLLDNPEAMQIINNTNPQLGTFMLDSVGTFTLEQGINFSKIPLTEDEVKDLNRQLATIKKPLLL